MMKSSTSLWCRLQSYLRSFGFKEEFPISERLKGRIVQDGLTFELYINGESFTDLSKKSYGYGTSSEI